MAKNKDNPQQSTAEGEQSAADEQLVAGEQPVVEAGRYLVYLDDQSPRPIKRVYAAESSEDAIQQHKEWMGIRGTVHNFSAGPTELPVGEVVR